MFASRHTSKIDRPPSACLKTRILFSVLYFLPFIRLVPFGSDYLIPRLEKAQSRQNAQSAIIGRWLPSDLQTRPLPSFRSAFIRKRTINAPHLCSPIQGFNAHQEKQRLYSCHFSVENYQAIPSDNPGHARALN